MGMEIAKGHIPGHTCVLKYGENPDIDTASGFETIWDGGGTYLPPTVANGAQIHDVASTSANDAGSVESSGTATGGSATTLVDSAGTFVTDGVIATDTVVNDTTNAAGQVIAVIDETTLVVGGWFGANRGEVFPNPASGDTYRIVRPSSTGASLLWLWGLDANFLEIEEYVVLNGTTNVPTTKEFARQFRSRVFGPGTSGAIGTITSTAQTDSTVSCQIIDGNNQSLMSIFTVPSNTIAYVTKWWAALSKQQTTTATTRLRFGSLENVSYILQSRSLQSAGSSEFIYDWEIPILVPGGTDIFVEANASSNDTAVASGFDIILVDKTAPGR